MRSRGEGNIRRRQNEDGSTFWEARVYLNGRRTSFYDRTKTGALAKARQALTDSERGTMPATSRVTVAAYLDAWLEAVVRPARRARTYENYAYLARTHIVPRIGRRSLTGLTPGHVQAMMADMLAQGLSESTAKRARAVLSSALRSAQLDYGLPRNAASLAKAPSADRPAFERETITPEDTRQILAAMRGSRLESLVLFSIATGLRQGELLALRWSDVDVEHRTVSIRYAVDKQGGNRVLARPKTKTSQRTLRLPDLALRALEMRRVQEAEDKAVAGDEWQELGLIFAGPTGGIRDGASVNRNFRARLERHGVEPVRWHALRRVFAAVLQDQGVPLERIRDLMGHSEIRVTESYAYTMPETLMRDMAAIDDAKLDPAAEEPERGDSEANGGTTGVLGREDAPETPSDDGLDNEKSPP